MTRRWEGDEERRKPERRERRREERRDECGTDTSTSCEQSGQRGTHGGESGRQTKESLFHSGLVSCESEERNSYETFRGEGYSDETSVLPLWVCLGSGRSHIWLHCLWQYGFLLIWGPFTSITDATRFKRGMFSIRLGPFALSVCGERPPGPSRAERTQLPEEPLTHSFVATDDEAVNFPTEASINTGCESGSDSKWKQRSRRLFVGSESSQLHEADQLTSPHPDQQTGSSSIADNIFLPCIR